MLVTNFLFEVKWCGSYTSAALTRVCTVTLLGKSHLSRPKCESVVQKLSNGNFGLPRSYLCVMSFRLVQVRQGGFGSSVDDMTHLYDKIVSELEQQVRGLLGTVVPSNPQVTALHGLHEAVLVARNSRDAVTAMALLQKVRSFLQLRDTNFHSS